MHGLTVGEVARRAAVHIDTLRYYERRGTVVLGFWLFDDQRHF